MSQINLKSFFDFCRVKVTKQSYDQEKKLVTMTINPDKRYDPVCHHCQQRGAKIHSYHERMVRDLNCFDAQTVLWIGYRTVKCTTCGNTVEELDFVDPGKRITKRLAQYLLFLCKVMTSKEITITFTWTGKPSKPFIKSILRPSFRNQWMNILAFW